MKVARIKIESPLGIFTQLFQIKGHRIRARMFSNVSETLEAFDASPLEGALRGLREELNFSVVPYRLISTGYPVEETKPSPTTGVMKSYQFWDFHLKIDLWEALALPLVIVEEGAVTFCWWR